MLSLFRQANTCQNYNPNIPTRILSISNKPFFLLKIICLGFEDQKRWLITFLLFKTLEAAGKLSRVASILFLPWKNGQPATLWLWLEVCAGAQQIKHSTCISCAFFHFQKTKGHTSIRDTEQRNRTKQEILPSNSWRAINLLQMNSRLKIKNDLSLSQNKARSSTCDSPALVQTPPVPPAQPSSGGCCEGTEQGRRSLHSSPGLLLEPPTHRSSRVPPTALDATRNAVQLRRKNKTTGKVLAWAFSTLQLTGESWLSISAGSQRYPLYL